MLYLHKIKYLACHVDCKNCTSPSVFDCDVCNLPIMHFNTTTSTCDCPKGMYKVQGICFRNIYIYIYI